MLQIASAKFQEVQKYLSVTGHVYTPAYILTSKKKFDALYQQVFWQGLQTALTKPRISRM